MSSISSSNLMRYPSTAEKHWILIGDAITAELRLKDNYEFMPKCFETNLKNTERNKMLVMTIWSDFKESRKKLIYQSKKK